MSLLLQALQKAAKSRDGSDGGEQPQSPAEVSRPDLSLEPLPQPAGREQAVASPEPTPAHAANVLRASEAPGFSGVDWAREHYMITFVGAALLFAVGYGVYIYIQVSNPGMFRVSPRPAATPLPAAQAPGPAFAQTEPPAATVSGLPAIQPANGGAVADSASAAVQPSAAVADETKSKPVRRVKPAGKGGSRLAFAATESDEASKRPVHAPEPDAVETVEIPASAPAAAGGQGDDISVRPDAGNTPRVNPDLLKAYDALKAGNYVEARTLYAGLLRNDPRNVDVLLGMAAVSWKEGHTDEAAGYYGRVLEVEPRNAHAQAGLIALMGAADPVAAESRLGQLISREPSGFLYFTLGNLYAEQGRWPAAQQAYFQAYQLTPDNPDYAFNLAVGLEHLGQTKLALDYYRKALDLSFKKGRANFDQNLAIERVGQLSARVN